MDLEENGGRGNIKAFNDIKKINPKLKTLVAVGGWKEGSHNYSLIANNPRKRQNFTRSAVEFIKKHGFDGLDLDWEYPHQRDSYNPSDPSSFVKWLVEIRAEFDKHGYLLTIAAGAPAKLASKSYDIPAIAKAVHYINLMTYDLHGSWDGKTGLNAPLYDSGDLSVNAAVDYWLKKGAPAEKLILGLPFYGRSFTLASSRDHDIGAPIYLPGLSGPYSREPGFLGYNEICANKEWNIIWNDVQLVPYAYHGSQWVGFDNQLSIQYKAQYALDRNLAGVMVWSVDTDDFRGNCGPKNALLKTVNSTLTGDYFIPIPEPQPGAVTDDCFDRESGFYPNSNDLHSFFYCDNGVLLDFECPGGLEFNPSTNSCDYPESVGFHS